MWCHPPGPGIAAAPPDLTLVFQEEKRKRSNARPDPAADVPFCQAREGSPGRRKGNFSSCISLARTRPPPQPGEMEGRRWMGHSGWPATVPATRKRDHLKPRGQPACSPEHGIAVGEGPSCWSVTRPHVYPGAGQKSHLPSHSLPASLSCIRGPAWRACVPGPLISCESGQVPRAPALSFFTGEKKGRDVVLSGPRCEERTSCSVQGSPGPREPWAGAGRWPPSLHVRGASARPPGLTEAPFVSFGRLRSVTCSAFPWGSFLKPQNALSGASPAAGALVPMAFAATTLSLLLLGP